MDWPKPLIFSATKFEDSIARLTGSTQWQPIWFVLLAVALGGVFSQLTPAEAGRLLGQTAVLLLTLIEPLVGLGVALLTGPLGAKESRLLDSGQG